MEIIIGLLVAALLTSAVVFIDEMMTALVPMTLYAEEYMTGMAGTSMVSVLFDIMFGVGVSLLILKFVKKGFETYVMWTDGDPDTEPTGLVIRFIQAMATAICFPVIYGWLGGIVESLSNELMTAIGTAASYDWMTWVTGVTSAGLMTGIFGLIFVICYFLLYFQFLMRGLEILILRIGVPVACVGLLDNDKGVFKAYSTKFIQSAFTVIIQICLCKLGVSFMLNMHIFWGVACMMLSLKTPKFLSEFLLAGGGGGGSVVNNVYHSVRLVGMARNLMK